MKTKSQVVLHIERFFFLVFFAYRSCLWDVVKFSNHCIYLKHISALLIHSLFERVHGFPLCSVSGTL